MMTYIKKNKKGRWVSGGNLEFYSETGTEGGYWAFASENVFYRHSEEDLIDGQCPWGESYCPPKDGSYHTHAKHEGLHILRDGDGLLIFDHGYNHPALVREESLEFSKFTIFEESSRGMWAHNHPIRPNIPLELWGHLFIDEYPAILITDKFPFMDQEGYEKFHSEVENVE